MAAAAALSTMRTAVLTAYAGREVVVDKPPRCQQCGRAIGEYAARPWSIKCRHCRAENRSG